MSLSVGTRLGPYEIVAPLGSGGMGEVWRARDARLARDVAIKVLPAAFSADGDRLARFRREAQVLAALNHPHIAAIHGLEESGGVEALVLELVPGETVAERLAKGPIPIDETLAIARQIADGLAAAHEKGIVHRDLKPANVKITPEGKVKILDFGLAKALSGDASSSEVSTSPTLTAAATQAGVVIGTAAYMSPEQARGRSVDKRTDIWAFGALLYEMLTGRRVFEGETVSDTLAAVLRAEIDWSALPAGTPAGVRRVLRRCLERDRDRRLHDIADARIEMDESEPPETAFLAATPPRRSWQGPALFAAGALLAAAATYFATRPGPPAPEPVRRFTLTGLRILIDGLQSLAISPDGSRLVYRGRGEDGFNRLFLRSFDSNEVKALPGTEQAALPFFSPDGEWIGFAAAGSLKKLALAAGSPQIVCRTGGGWSGGTWLSDGTIVFVGDPEAGLQRVSAEGGTPEILMKPDPKTGEHVVVTPWALPGGKGVLVAARRGAAFGIAAYSFERRELKMLAEDGFTPAYSAGYVLFQQGMGPTLLALPFDAERLAATGPAFPAHSSIGTRISFQARTFGVSDNGTLVYIPQTATLGRGALLWVDRRGSETPIVEMPKPIDTPRLSPDGSRIAFRSPAPNCDLWVFDLARGTTTRLTLEGDNHGVVWTPDGKSVAFARANAPRGISSGGLAVDLLAASAGGGASVESLAPEQPGDPIPSSMSSDGRLLLCGTSGRDTVGDIEVVHLGEKPQRRALVRTPFDESQAVFSPDGRHIAYVSGESGRFEVYVQPYPALDSRAQVSTDGGIAPVWSRDGRELFFRQGRWMMAADVRTIPDFAASRPRPLFEGGTHESASVGSYDVTADGQRFLMVRGRTRTGDPEVEVVLGWIEELRRSARREASK